MTARHIGPALMSGRINDLEVHPTNSRIIYAGAPVEGFGNQMMPALPSILFSMNIASLLVL